MKRPLCFCCLFFLILLRAALFFTGLPKNPYDGHDGEVCVHGIVTQKEYKNGKTLFYLEEVCLAGNDAAGADGNEVYDGTETDTQKGKTPDIGLICAVEDGEVPPIGARTEVRGKLWVYSGATNPGEFDLRAYYLCRGFGGRINVASWQEIGDGRYDVFREKLWQLRCLLGAVYERILPAEDAGVMRAVVLGDKGELSADLKELYRVNGIVHILAISGLHISILGMGLYRFLRRLSLPVLPCAAASVGFMVIYAVFVGAGISTVRAVMMFGILAFAEVERRSYDLPTALLLSAASTAVFNPYELCLSAFWMSYLAVCGIAVFYPTLFEGVRFAGQGWRDKKSPIPVRKYLGKFFSALCGSMSVSLFTLPLILTYYYEVPLYASFLNLIVIPLMSVLMICGLTALLIGCAFPVASVAAAYPCHLILAFYARLCEGISKLPFHSAIVGSPGTARLLIAYGLFALVLLTGRRRLGKLWSSRHPFLCRCRSLLHIPAYGKDPASAWKEVRLRYVLLFRGILCAAALWLLLLHIRSGLTVTMLDVGQGDGICLETADKVLMIDGGSTSKSELAKYQLAPFLKYRGIGKVDLWYVTHPDSDHDSGLLELLADRTQTIRIGAIVLPDAFGAEEDFEELITLAKERGVPVLWNSAGSRYSSGDLLVECLHPAAGYRTEDVNSYSQVLAVSGYGFSGLFTGDATVESEAEILKNEEGNLLFPEAADRFRASSSGGRGPYLCLKLGHHGSSTSSSQAFLDYVSPQIALISCGYQNRYGHPHEEVLKRLYDLGCAVYRTDLDGAVILHADGGRFRITRFAPRAQDTPCDAAEK